MPPADWNRGPRVRLKPHSARSFLRGVQIPPLPALGRWSPRAPLTIEGAEQLLIAVDGRVVHALLANAGKVSTMPFSISISTRRAA
jgi:hypothetical protein